MKNPIAGSAPATQDTGEYWSRKLQGSAFSPECCWRVIAEVDRQRTRKETGGSPYGHWAEYCVREFLAGRTPVERMLSVGCGTGLLERILARLGAFHECDAWDIAAGAVETARRLARQEGFDHIHYEVRDITAVELPPDCYDTVWFENALHHIEALEKVCANLARGLKPDGYLFLNEYVGPPRFAFPPRQRELIRAAFALIPARFRRHRETGMILTSAAIPTPAEVEADDPTESIRSSDIPEVVAAYFDVVAFHESGGSLLQFLLNGIAGNFRDDDPESLRVIDMLLRLEEELLEIGELRSDFAVMVARPRRPWETRRALEPAMRPAPPVQDEGPTALVSVEEELAQKRTSLIAAERYARSLEQELARQEARRAELEGYVQSLEAELARQQEKTAGLEGTAQSLQAELARKQMHAGEIEGYARSLQAELALKQAHAGEIEGYARSLEAEVARLEERIRSLESDLHSRRRPRVQAVIVHHRDKDLLDHCLRRLLASQRVELQVVVVANACQEPLPEISSRDPIHVVVADTSLGFSAANNLGVAWACEHLGEPDHWLFLNNDAGVEAGTLWRLAEALESTPRAGVAGPQLRIWGAEDHLNSLGLNVTMIGEAWDEGIGVALADYGPLPPRQEVLAVTGSALLIVGETLREIGGWNELYGYYMEDIDLCLQARSRGWKVILVPEAVAEHAISATADQITDFKRLLSWRNQLVLVLRHWPAGTLLRTVPRLVGGQLKVFVQRLRLRAYVDARLQARAWAGALRLLPRAVSQRLQSGGDRSWTRFLRPTGSVPVIRLPAIPPGRRPWEPPVSGAASGPETEAT
jgi:GT2 family glycosyltransferase/SAM-dependent methyltransferase